MNDEEKIIIKKKLIEKINKILINNNIDNHLDNLTTLNMSNTTSFIGSIPILDDEKLNQIQKELTNLFQTFGKSSLRTEEVISCCKPKYNNISFKINVTN